jgi:hypothetical protein
LHGDGFRGVTGGHVRGPAGADGVVSSVRNLPGGVAEGRRAGSAHRGRRAAARWRECPLRQVVEKSLGACPGFPVPGVSEEKHPERRVSTRVLKAVLDAPTTLAASKLIDLCTEPRCLFCMMLRRRLRTRGIEFREINI